MVKRYSIVLVLITRNKIIPDPLMHNFKIKYILLAEDAGVHPRFVCPSRYNTIDKSMRNATFKVVLISYVNRRSPCVHPGYYIDNDK